MLSHLMGASNCADLRRMRQLEEEVAALSNKIERQQRHLRDGFVERDQKIERLTRSLAERISSEHEIAPADDGSAVLKATITELNKRLVHEAGRSERLEQRLQSMHDAEAARRLAERERDVLRAELDIVDRQLAGLVPEGAEGDAPPLQLAGLTVLYVGGRANQIPQLRALVERSGGSFMHHDGGIEHASALLPGLVSRCDLAVWPVDCVSHNAMTAAKRACQQSGKRFAALRASSVTSLLAVLTPSPAAQ